MSDSLNEILKKNDNITIIDFNNEKIDCGNNIERALVGPEGGFSEDERKMFKNLKVLGFDTPFVLKSESAAIAISAKVLL